jgi:hypothetical protein
MSKWKKTRSVGKNFNDIIGETNSLTKKSKKNIGSISEIVADKKRLDTLKESTEIVKKKKITKTQYAALLVGGSAVAVGGITAAKAIEANETYQKRNNANFKVTEITYDKEDDKDEISLSISNPDKLDIYAQETIIFLSANDVLKNKIVGKIFLNDRDYEISEVRPFGDSDDLIPNLIKVKITGLDLTDVDKDMIMKGDGLFTIKLRADFNNDFKREMEELMPPDLFDWTYLIEILKNIGIGFVSIIVFLLLLYIIKTIYDVTKK